MFNALFHVYVILSLIILAAVANNGGNMLTDALYYVESHRGKRLTNTMRWVVVIIALIMIGIAWPYFVKDAIKSIKAAVKQ